MPAGAPYQPSIEQDGQDGAPPLVLVHGTPLDLRCWDALVPTLAKSLRPIRYDVRGHGTAAASAVPGSYDVLAEDLLGVLDALAVERAHVVGHSFGGQIAQAFALRFPARLASLTVVCARARPFPPFAEAAATIRADGPEALVEPTLSRWFLPQALSPSAPAEEATAVAYARERLRDAHRESYARSLELIARFDVLEQLSEVQAPARFIAAERDAISSPQELRRSSESARHGRFELFAGAGHLLPLEQPRALARMLVDGLATGG